MSSPEPMPPDDALARWISGPADDHDVEESDSPDRVDRILGRHRREVALRDVLTFGLARIWTALLSMTGAVAAAWGETAAGSRRPR